MKKITALVLSLLLAFSITACKGNKDPGDSSSTLSADVRKLRRAAAAENPPEAVRRRVSVM